MMYVISYQAVLESLDIRPPRAPPVASARDPSFLVSAFIYIDFIDEEEEPMKVIRGHNHPSTCTRIQGDDCELHMLQMERLDVGRENKDPHHDTRSRTTIKDDR